MFDFAAGHSTRRMSLTPMIDVVFLLLVFFMLVARFGADRSVALVTAGAAQDDWTGPPRLVEIAPAELRLNGVALPERALLSELVRLTGSGSDPVVLRPADGASLQRLVDTMALMDAAGFTNLAIAEARP